MRTCPYCEKQVLEEDKFCGWCGQKLPAELTEKEKELVRKIREEARRKASEIKETEEKTEEKRVQELIRKRAREKAGEIKKVKTRREKIIEKLTKIPKEEIEKREEFLKTIGVKVPRKKTGEKPPPPRIKTKEVIFRPLGAKTPPFEKVFIRILFVFLILSIAAAILIIGFDIFGWRTGEKLVLPPKVAEKPSEPGEKPEEIVIPPPLLSTEASTVLEIPFLDRLPNAFAEGLKGLDDKTLIRVIIENLEERKVVSLEDFLNIMDVTTPSTLYQYLEPDFTLLSYSPQNLHIGFIVKIKENQKEKLANSLASWEPEMKEDFDPFFAYLGAGKVMAVQFFADSPYLGENFRYITFYQKNLGMCYGIVKDYFIFTTSGELMLKLIEYKVELTKTLRGEDRGVEVEILQAWLAKDPNIYPPGLITGYFGPLTQEAVVRFQQKYSEDILKPYGLVQGTGIVDDATRKKLNEIYRK